MKGNHLVVLVLSAVLAGCGDNSTTCGPGTVDNDGVCAPVASCGSGTMDDGTGTCVPSGTVCGPGTMLDPVTNTCTLTSGDCQDGTVLVGNQCIDPAGMLTIDLQEGPEPNAMGLFGVECAPDATHHCTTPPAGTIALKPSGQSFVVHGHTIPFQDENNDGDTDPDVDTYVLTVAGPTLLHVSVDGVGGEQGGFLAVASNAATGDPLATYRRVGVNVTGDTANREIMLPGAGTYLIGVTDARSLTFDSAFGDSSSEYYMSITQEDLPTPAAITVTPGQTTQMSDTIDSAHDKFYAAQMGDGLHDIVVLATPTAVFTPAFDVITNDVLRADAEQSFDPNLGFTPPEAVLAGFKTGDSTLIVVDPQVNAAFDPQAYTITVKAGVAVPLPTDGSSIASPVVTSSPPQVNADVTDINAFFYDVANAGDAPGFALHFDRPVDGAVIDGNLNVISRFTLDPADHFSGTTFQDFGGQIRHPRAGRYYFLVLDHAGIPGQTSITATNTLTTVTPTAVSENTETAGIPTTPFNAFTYVAAGDVWDDFAADADATGDVTLQIYDAGSAVGRLDPLTTSAGPVAADATPLFTKVVTPGSGSLGAAHGEVLLDFPQPTWFGRIASAAGAAHVRFEITPKAFGDFGTIHAGDPAKTLAGNQLAGASDTAFFLVRTDDAANLMQLVGTPTATDIAISSLAADESVITTVDKDAGVETAVYPVQPNRWLAVAVTGTAAGTFDLSAAVGTETHYVASSATAPAYASICTPQNVVAMHDDGNDFGSDDEGLSDELPVPSGFRFYGADVGQVQLSTNGWLSFFPQTSSFGIEGNTSLPSAAQPLALIAPYWSDLFGVVVCAQTTSTAMTVEWQGQQADSGLPVAFQVHLDATTGVIELVYNPDPSNMQDDGSDATIGLQDFVGGSAILYDFDGSDSSGNPFSLSTSTALLATPN